MRHRSIGQKEEMMRVIHACRFCQVAMVDPAGMPYLIPMNFGFANDTIYLHSAQKGKKIDILKRHPDVCINFTTDHELRYQSEQVACSWSMKYRSVLCYGKVRFLNDPEQKVSALNIIMNNYSERTFSYNAPSIREVNCWIVPVDRFEGRAYGY